jgi:glycosyltransferase involved in cell wall biosynthesis
MHRAADLLEGSWRRIAKRCPVVVVGPSLRRNYSHSPAVLEIAVSLVSAADVAAGRVAGARIYDGQLQLLSVGRLDPEKNPLLLADAFAQIHRADQRWRLVVCGEGPMTDGLERRLRELGLSEVAEIRGYVPLHGGLLDLYRSSHAFLHVSLTEGMPQVLIEAFASGVPVVATAVGGVPDAVGSAALLIPANDADAAAAAVLRTGSDVALRGELIDAGLRHAERHTLEQESARVAQLIAQATAHGTPRTPIR